MTADICTKWLIDEDRVADRRINIPLTVARVRSQRSGCVQVAAQYVFCYRVLIDFATSVGLLSEQRGRAALAALTAPEEEEEEGDEFGSSFLSSTQSSSSLPRPYALLPGAAMVGSAAALLQSAASSSSFASNSRATRSTLSELRNLLSSHQWLPRWTALKSKKDRRGGGSRVGGCARTQEEEEETAIRERDFIMTENVNSEDSDEADAKQFNHNHHLLVTLTDSDVSDDAECDGEDRPPVIPHSVTDGQSVPVVTVDEGNHLTVVDESSS